MSEHTAISWCDSTFNPWIGCTKVSPACDHCYAERLMDHRMGKVKWGACRPRVRTSAANWHHPLVWERAAWRFVQCLDCGRREPAIVSNGATRCRACSSTATTPARPRVFCASLGDVFDNEVPEVWRFDLLNLIADTPNLDWLLLTKRIGNARAMLDAFVRSDGHRGESWGSWPNVWLGITVVNQAEADRDIPKLLVVPAAKRFVSIEPMLGDIRLGSWLQRSPSAAFEAGRVTADMPAWTRLGSTALDWVICGGESGPQARPMHPDWVRSLRDQCAVAGVPLHFKQWGEWAPSMSYPVHDCFRWPQALPAADATFSYRVGTKAAGRLLDGVEHNGFPHA